MGPTGHAVQEALASLYGGLMARGLVAKHSLSATPPAKMSLTKVANIFATKHGANPNSVLRMLRVTLEEIDPKIREDMTDPQAGRPRKSIGTKRR